MFAASSLSEVMGALAEEFESTGPDRQVLLNLAGSHILASQILEGAPAHVFASADHRQMQRVSDAGKVRARAHRFATTEMAIAVEAGNPHRILALGDLSRSDLVVVLAAPEVPAGRYSQEVLDLAGITVRADSYEIDVRSALSKVALGEADATIVYRSDGHTRTAIDLVTIPQRHNVMAEFPIASLTDSHPLAEEFIRLVLSADGRRILNAHGFSTP